MYLLILPLFFFTCFCLFCDHVLYLLSSYTYVIFLWTPSPHIVQSTIHSESNELWHVEHIILAISMVVSLNSICSINWLFLYSSLLNTWYVCHGMFPQKKHVFTSVYSSISEYFCLKFSSFNFLWHGLHMNSLLKHSLHLSFNSLATNLYWNCNSSSQIWHNLSFENYVGGNMYIDIEISLLIHFYLIKLLQDN